MILNSLRDLAPVKERAVIINVGTKTVSTLALLAALRHAGMPVLLIDCEYGDGSLEHFTRLHESHGFDLLSAPLRKHGPALDWLFANIPDENVLLIDSDLEILGPEIVDLARTLLDGSADGETVFGSGFTHGPCWLHDHPGVGWYQERMWIPLTFLRVDLVREALANGRSFAERLIHNDFAPSRLVSRLLALRFRVPFLRGTRLSWLRGLRGSYYGQKPSYVFSDTGAEVFQYLKYERGWRYAGIPAELHRRFVKHFHGTTRRALDPNDLNSLQEGSGGEVEERLLRVYGVRVGRD
jgi:hypothetical protein